MTASPSSFSSGGLTNKPRLPRRTISAQVSAAEAQAWCSERLAEVGVHVTEWEHPVNDTECWQMLDPLRVRFYELRRHYDAWAVVAVIPISAAPQYLNLPT